MKQAETQIIRELNRIHDAVAGGSGGAPAFADITGDPSDNSNLATALLAKQTEAQVQTIADAKVESEAYGPTWNGDTTHAPAKNDVYDKIEAVVASIPPAHSGGVIGTGWFTIVGTAVDTQFGNGVITSVTYNGVGDYTVNFTGAQADTNYIAHVTVEADSAVSAQVPIATKTVNDFKILVFRGTDNTAREVLYGQITIERLSQ